MKYLLPVYFLLFFGLAILLPTYRVWKATGVNPYKLGPTSRFWSKQKKKSRLQS